MIPMQQHIPEKDIGKAMGERFLNPIMAFFRAELTCSIKSSPVSLSATVILSFDRKGNKLISKILPPLVLLTSLQQSIFFWNVFFSRY